MGDTHFPYVNKKSLLRVLSAIDDVKPDFIIQIGDLYDAYAWSKFPLKKQVHTAEEEITLGRKQAEEFWHKAIKSSKRSKCFQLSGNHDQRIYKKLFAQGCEFSFLYPAIDRLFDFEGVETINEQRDELILDKRVYMHGFRSQLGDHARHNGMSTICGHSHVGGTVFIRQGAHTIWELNAGFIADTESIALSYSQQRRFSRTTQGFGFIDHVGPRFVPLPNEG